jgi:hypothetical protein
MSLKNKNTAPGNEKGKKEPLYKRILGKLAVSADRSAGSTDRYALMAGTEESRRQEIKKSRIKAYESMNNLASIAQENRGMFRSEYQDRLGSVTKVSVVGDRYGMRSSLTFESQDNPENDLVFERVKLKDKAEPNFILRRLGKETLTNNFLEYIPLDQQEAVCERITVIAGSVVASYHAQPLPKNVININAKSSGN